MSAPVAQKERGAEVVADTLVNNALEDLRAIETARAMASLVPLAIDLRNATLDNPIAYRQRSRELRKNPGLDSRISGRLDRIIGDDPIRLAKRRQFDSWHRLWARSFNAISQPLGSSIVTGFVLAPFQLANSLVHYLADFSNLEPLSTTDRQALVLRQEFLRRHPSTEQTFELEKMNEKSMIRLAETLALRRIRSAEVALERSEPALALHQIRTAKKVLDAHPKENVRLQSRVEQLETKTSIEISEQSRHRLRSLKAVLDPDEPHDAARALARTMLTRPSGSRDLDQRLTDYRMVAKEDGIEITEFIVALRQHENGFDLKARERLTKLAGMKPAQDNMPRHAKTLIEDAWQNPYGAFRQLEGRANREELAWRLAGEWVRRTRYPNLPTPVAVLIDTPTIAMTMVLAPLRAMTSPWTGSPDFRRAPALAGYRYLHKFPEGTKQREVVDWLYDYEIDEERWGRALRLADLIPNFDSTQRLELVEKTADGRLAQVDRLARRDDRTSVLSGVAREFPDSEGGREAGMRARAEVSDASAQRIRITKGFMLENPSVAGPDGLGLNPRLLNGDDADGELHPDGILLRGGRMLEILLVAEGADKEDGPESRSRKISKHRLSRIASTLDEAVQRNSLIDIGARQTPDASRDVYLERAGLGLTETIDQRPAAESTHVYQSLRERYGLVRGRESILPFDLVFRGSLGDFSLGAFPRWRPPRETPDAFLYR
jgi:hypothetical protein